MASNWCQGRLRLDIRNKFFVGAIRHRSRLPRVEGESLPLEVSRNHGDGVRGDVVSGHGGDGLMVRFDGLTGLFQH